eukprot:CAMPEP_0114393084 /NCGR_PEP_ID=MMETSP0102-20121206/11259_1 /TAXON_ID=38822 ORGANISM="Pteridomonas danica, Strain PT" /NCGR_SAMPLE_ID=MMETSP0102 /ASSEMBLY_ACC=CAM_ASM_000212 /LENGTH=147 /DNA_ID=CAMNT_0001552539 /DNA_START=361 /DNA_END=805 /DNA_ORIENTATION=-
MDNLIEDEEEDQVPIYLNRLSDYLFTAARWVAQENGNTDIQRQAKTMENNNGDDDDEMNKNAVYDAMRHVKKDDEDKETDTPSKKQDTHFEVSENRIASSSSPSSSSSSSLSIDISPLILGGLMASAALMGALAAIVTSNIMKSHRK